MASKKKLKKRICDLQQQIINMQGHIDGARAGRDYWQDRFYELLARTEEGAFLDSTDTVHLSNPREDTVITYKYSPGDSDSEATD
jgi:hypothetical protein